MTANLDPYLGLVAVTAVTALAERWLALGHERRLRASGAMEVAPAVFLAMVPAYSLHFIAAGVEHVTFDRRPPDWLALSMVALLVASKALKAWAAASLGPLWTMRVFIPAGLQPVTRGPYRYIRHPNYVAVMGEILALPLAGGCYVTAGLFGAVFAVILLARIRTEESALFHNARYAETMGGRGRFVPGSRPR